MSGGFGSGGFGSSSYGFGDVPRVNSTVAKLLRKEDGTIGDCVKLDVVSGDYVLDATGNKVGWDSLKQQVYLALRTHLGSSAVQTMGIELPSGIITDQIAVKNRNAVNAALKKLTDQGLIEIVDVITTRIGTSALKIEVKWRDLSDGTIESSFV